MAETNNPIINYSKTLKKRTPGNSYKDILHIGNNGEGIDDTSPVNIFDGKGTWSGISLSRSEINLDLGEGRMTGALLGGTRFTSQKETVYDHSDIFINLHKCSCYFIYQGDPASYPYGLDYHNKIYLSFLSDSDDSILAKGKIFIRNISDYNTTIEFTTGENNSISGGGIQNEYSGSDWFIYDILCLYNIDDKKNNEFIINLSDRVSF